MAPCRGIILQPSAFFFDGIGKVALVSVCADSSGKILGASCFVESQRDLLHFFISTSLQQDMYMFHQLLAAANYIPPQTHPIDTHNT